MPTQKYPINLATIAGLYGCSESVAKRMSAANVDLQNPFEVQQFLQAHARERTRNGTENSAVFSAVKAVEKPTYYLDVFASLYGVRKERLEAIVEAGVDLRNRKAVRAALAAQGTPPDQSPAAASQKPSPVTAKPKIQEDPRAIAILAARRAHWDRMPSAEKAKWTPETVNEWLTKV